MFTSKLFHRPAHYLAALFTLLTLSFASNLAIADGHGGMKSQEGWFYVGEYNHNTNQFQMSYFDAITYPKVEDRLTANRAVNMRNDRPTDQGVLGEKVGMIMKNYILVVTDVAKGSAPGGIEDVWVKGTVQKAN